MGSTASDCGRQPASIAAEHSLQGQRGQAVQPAHVLAVPTGASVLLSQCVLKLQAVRLLFWYFDRFWIVRDCQPEIDSLPQSGAR